MKLGFMWVNERDKRREGQNRPKKIILDRKRTVSYFRELYIVKNILENLL